MVQVPDVHSYPSAQQLVAPLSPVQQVDAAAQPTAVMPLAQQIDAAAMHTESVAVRQQVEAAGQSRSCQLLLITRYEIQRITRQGEEQMKV
jgi:hypothetical protein